MRVKLLTSMAGHRFEAHYGQELNLPDADARRLIARGQAAAVAPVSPGLVETAAAVAPEVAAQRVRKPRRLFGKAVA